MKLGEPTLDQLRIFIAVAEAGAAEHLAVLVGEPRVRSQGLPEAPDRPRGLLLLACVALGLGLFGHAFPRVRRDCRRSCPARRERGANGRGVGAR